MRHRFCASHAFTSANKRLDGFVARRTKYFPAKNASNTSAEEACLGPRPGRTIIPHGIDCLMAQEPSMKELNLVRVTKLEVIGRPASLKSESERFVLSDTFARLRLARHNPGALRQSTPPSARCRRANMYSGPNARLHSATRSLTLAHGTRVCSFRGAKRQPFMVPPEQAATRDRRARFVVCLR